MAGFESIAAVGLSIERLLNACFAERQPISTDTPSTAALVRTEDFARKEMSRIPATGVSIFAYRVDYNRAMRAAWSAAGSRTGRGHLPLDLHFLLTAWAQNAQHELQIMGRVLQCLESIPILSGPLLESTGGWETGDAVQVVLGELTTEEVMRTFDSLPHDYKLSVPYVARVVRIDTGVVLPPDVLTTVTGVVAGSGA